MIRKRVNMNKNKYAIIVIAVIMQLLITGCSSKNMFPGRSAQTSSKAETSAAVQNVGDIDIENYPDKIAAKLDEFPLYDKAWVGSYRSPLLLYNTRKDINFLAKVKKVTFTSTNIHVIMIYKNISSKALTISKNDYPSDYNEAKDYLPTIKLGIGETKEVELNLPKKYMWSMYDGVYMVSFKIKNTEFYIAQYDGNEKITDAKPVEKYMRDSALNAIKYSSIKKNSILGNKKVKILCNGVDILDIYKNGIQDETAYIGYAKITIANTSTKDISISDGDISSMLSLNGKTEVDMLHNNKTLPKFTTKVIKPSEIKTFKIPVLLGSELWTRIDIEIDNEKFVFAGIENLQID